jgi:hypothetical protein
MVDKQALPQPLLQFQLLFLRIRPHLEAQAWLDATEHADQPVFNSVPHRHPLGQRFLVVLLEFRY